MNLWYLFIKSLDFSLKKKKNPWALHVYFLYEIWIHLLILSSEDQDSEMYRLKRRFLRDEEQTKTYFIKRHTRLEKMREVKHIIGHWVSHCTFYYAVMFNKMTFFYSIYCMKIWTWNVDYAWLLAIIWYELIDLPFYLDLKWKDDYTLYMYIL